MTKRFLLFIFLYTSLFNLADSNSIDAAQFIQQKTDSVLKIVAEAQRYVANDPDRYYKEIANVLVPIVDMQKFSRGVMGSYASEKRLQNLSAQEREKVRQQIDRFSCVLQNSLTRTYGKSLLQFSGETIRVEPIAKADLAKDQISVVQHIIDKDQIDNIVYYHMKRHMKRKEGAWLISNITVNGINVGQSYRSQFNAALESYNNNVDEAITHWPEIMNQQGAQLDSIPC